MGDLSKNFSLDEFRCPCCGLVMICRELVQGLQDFRAHVDYPVMVTSGYRCAAHEKAVGGASGYHPLGWAVDVTVEHPGRSIEEMFLAAVLIKTFRFGGIGVDVENKMLHLDCRLRRARWGYKTVNGVRRIVAITDVINPCEILPSEEDEG
jgi:hypothetical protein